MDKSPLVHKSSHFPHTKQPGWCRKLLTFGKSRMTLHSINFSLRAQDGFVHFPTDQSEADSLITFCTFCEDGYKIVLSPFVKAFS